MLGISSNNSRVCAPTSNVSLALACVPIIGDIVQGLQEARIAAHCVHIEPEGNNTNTDALSARQVQDITDQVRTKNKYKAAGIARSVVCAVIIAAATIAAIAAGLLSNPFGIAVLFIWAGMFLGAAAIHAYKMIQNNKMLEQGFQVGSNIR
ncbi:MAG: hypothetical protein JSS32_05095 [Verrucomicrobia bacterium]|nr:hypothetical protein [Verrucomicrobiota bacterium]